MKSKVLFVATVLAMAILPAGGSSVVAHSSPYCGHSYLNAGLELWSFQTHRYWSPTLDEQTYYYRALGQTVWVYGHKDYPFCGH